MSRPRLREQPLTNAERQARRRERERAMKAALERIAAECHGEAREIARRALGRPREPWSSGEGQSHG